MAQEDHISIVTATFRCY